MDNHVHFLVETGEIPLPKMMQVILSKFTMHYNHIHERVGHLFQGRYKSCLVDSEGYFLELVRYILNNPVRAGIVEKAKDYEWSSVNSYFSPGKNLVEVGLVKEYFNKQRELFSFLRARDISFDPEPERIRSVDILGNKEYIESVMQYQKKERRAERRKPENRKRRITKEVAKHYGLKPSYLLKPGKQRDKSHPRRVLVYLLRKCCHMENREIGAQLGISAPTISVMLNRLSCNDKRAATVIENQST